MVFPTNTNLIESYQARIMKRRAPRDFASDMKAGRLQGTKDIWMDPAS